MIPTANLINLNVSNVRQYFLVSKGNMARVACQPDMIVRIGTFSSPCCRTALHGIENIVLGALCMSAAEQHIRRTYSTQR